MALLSHLPTFIVVGSQKSGTSTIFAAMREHPSVRVPDLQEVHFFDDDRFHNKGLGACRK